MCVSVRVSACACVLVLVYVSVSVSVCLCVWVSGCLCVCVCVVNAPVSVRRWGVDPEALNRLKLVASSNFERCPYTKAIGILKDAIAKVSGPLHRALPALS